MSQSTPVSGGCRKRRVGFTLVELLVVIGIIAVLVGILLPSLSAARRSAQQVKCATALQQIGLGFIMYANEMKGWWPVTKFDPTLANSTYPNTFAAGNYYIDDQIYNTGSPAYWQNFIAAYVNAAAVGNAANSSTAVMGQTKRTVLWGCPAWEQYQNYTVTIQTGYGMNGFPTFDQNAPNSTPATSDICEIAGGTAGRFFKQVEWTNPSGRALVGDCIFWFMESDIPTAGALPPAIAVGGQPAAGNSITTTAGVTDQTLVDIYRHGRKPSIRGSGTGATYDPYGGKIGYNMLFCDGHVGEFSEAQTAYQSVRQRFPN